MIKRPSRITLVGAAFVLAAIAAIRHAQSRGVLVPLAEARLGLRLPQDTEIVILQVPRAR